MEEKNINQEFEIKSYIGVTATIAKFKFKFLSNKLRCQVIDIDAKFTKLWKKFNKAAAANNYQKELEVEIESVEKSDLADEEKIEMVHDLKLQYAEKIDESGIDNDAEKTKAIWLMNDKKNIEIIQLISLPLTADDANLINNSPDSEFWRNADIGTAASIIEFFRKYYRI